MSVYVEIRIRAPMDALWEHTQVPDLHERWDLRFSRIEYLLRGSDAEPQRFRYATRIGLGMEIAGEGESTGHRDLADGSRTSALSFRSSDPRSIIREGAGYWKYIPTDDGIRFLTWYDYRTRWGIVGWIVDRVVFRPLMGWATAWSFDRLRLWLEHGIDPALAARQAIVHGVARVGLAGVFAYEGLVPKLIERHADEIRMVTDAGVAPRSAMSVLVGVGIAEVILAACLLVGWRRRWPSVLCLGLMVGATVAVAMTSPTFLGAPFNPVTLNLAVACLAVIDLLTLRHLPTSARCRRAAAAPRS